jgi:hypothetical protein
LLAEIGIDVRLVQELMRHARLTTTMEVYTRAGDGEQRIAQSSAVDVLFNRNAQTEADIEHAMFRRTLYLLPNFALSSNWLNGLVDLVGIEPTTSSMPWKRAPSCATGPHRRRTFVILGYLDKFVKLRTNVKRCDDGNCLKVALTFTSSNPVKYTRIGLFMRDSKDSSSFSRRITLGLLMFLSLWLLTAVLMPAQTAQSPPTSGTTTTFDLQPIRSATDSLRQAVSSVNTSRWKTSNEVKSVSQNDLNSIFNDLNSVLPGLLQTAQASPSSFKPAFEVYRNVNALYDVVLRVSQAASLTGAATDAAYLQNALNELSRARNSLSNALAAASEQRDTELVQLRAKVQAQDTQAAPPKKIIVDDGPNGSSASKKSKSSKTPNQQ